MLKQYRQRFTWGFVLLLLVLAVIANFINSNVGIPLSMAGLIGLVFSAVIAFVTAMFVDLLDVTKFNLKEIARKLFPLAWSVLLAASLMTPLIMWLQNIVGG